MNFTSKRKTKGIVALEVTPIVDVVFLLLIFFLLTATYVKNPNLDIELPKASVDQASTHKKDIVVAIKSDGEIRFDNKVVDMDKLEGVLRAQFAEEEEAVVVVRADQGSKHGRVVEVMDLAKRIGFSKLAIATKGQGASAPE